MLISPFLARPQPKSMKLSFKGDKKSKSSSSKRHRSTSPGDDAGESSSKRKSSRRSKAVEEEQEGGEPGDWVFPELAGEVNGPTFIWAPSDPPCCISVRVCPGWIKVDELRLISRCSIYRAQFDAQRSRVVPFPLPDLPAAESSGSSSAQSALPAALAYEPLEIAHVWVVSQLSGSTSINLRTASGKFLACDRFGVVTAESESRGPLESFNVHVLGGGSGSVALETTYVFSFPKERPSSKRAEAACCPRQARHLPLDLADGSVWSDAPRRLDLDRLLRDVPR
jgi:hypothetical protein